MAAELGIDVKITGSNDYSALKGSDIVVVTAGLARKPGMTRMDLLMKNAGIIKSVTGEVAKYAPDSKLIMVTNPLDAMTYVALKTTGFKNGRVFGMGGMLDLSRFKQLLSEELHVSRFFNQRARAGRTRRINDSRCLLFVSEWDSSEAFPQRAAD